MRITTTVSRSGHPRSVILAYLDDGPNAVTMARNGWDAAEPGLVAEPASRPALWELWRKVDRDLDAYARRRPGRTAVVVFEPAEAEALQPDIQLTDQGSPP